MITTVFKWEPATKLDGLSNEKKSALGWVLFRSDCLAAKVGAFRWVNGLWLDCNGMSRCWSADEFKLIEET